MISYYLIYPILFVLGVCFGSFLNAIGIRISQVIDKFYDKCEEENWSFLKNLKEELKLLTLSNNPKRSICPVCKNQLKWYHNIPLLSYIFLKGKCQYCKTPIPFIYFFSEILLGILTPLIYYYSTKLNIPIYATISFIISMYIIYIGMIVDMRKRFIPDFSLIIPIPFLFLYSYYYNNENLISIVHNIGWGLFLYFSLKYLIIFIYKKTNKLLMGIADIKMLAILMIIAGISKTIFILFLANYLAFPFFIYNYLKNKNNTLDFGIFIYISFIIILYFHSLLYNLIMN